MRGMVHKSSPRRCITICAVRRTFDMSSDTDSCHSSGSSLLPIDDAVEQLKSCLTPSRYHIDVRGMADKSSPRRGIKICAVHRTFDTKLDTGTRSQSPERRELLPFLLSRLIPAVSGVILSGPRVASVCSSGDTA